MENEQWKLDPVPEVVWGYATERGEWPPEITILWFERNTRGERRVATEQKYVKADR